MPPSNASTSSTFGFSFFSSLAGAAESPEAAGAAAEEPPPPAPPDAITESILPPFKKPAKRAGQYG